MRGPPQHDPAMNDTGICSRDLLDDSIGRIHGYRPGPRRVQLARTYGSRFRCVSSSASAIARHGSPASRGHDARHHLNRMIQRRTVVGSPAVPRSGTAVTRAATAAPLPAPPAATYLQLHPQLLGYLKRSTTRRGPAGAHPTPRCTRPSAQAGVVSRHGRTGCKGRNRFSLSSSGASRILRSRRFRRR